MNRRSSSALVFFSLCACSSSSVSSPADAGDETTTAIDAPADVDKSATCASTFGSSLTDAFGRIDGTVLAVVPPNDQQCALPNSTHLVIQVLVASEAYRMVVDVHSSLQPPDVLFTELDAPLAAGAWSEGWHPSVALDYVTTLGVHSDAFTSMPMDAIVAKITSEIELGAHVSVFVSNRRHP